MNGGGSASVDGVERKPRGPTILTVTNRCVPSLDLIVLLCLHNNIDLIQLTLQCTLAMRTDLWEQKTDNDFRLCFDSVDQQAA